MLAGQSIARSLARQVQMVDAEKKIIIIKLPVVHMGSFSCCLSVCCFCFCFQQAVSKQQTSGHWLTVTLCGQLVVVASVADASPHQLLVATVVCVCVQLLCQQCQAQSDKLLANWTSSRRRRRLEAKLARGKPTTTTTTTTTNWRRHFWSLLLVVAALAGGHHTVKTCSLVAFDAAQEKVDQYNEDKTSNLFLSLSFCCLCLLSVVLDQQWHHHRKLAGQLLLLLSHWIRSKSCNWLQV